MNTIKVPNSVYSLGLKTNGHIDEALSLSAGFLFGFCSISLCLVVIDGSHDGQGGAANYKTGGSLNMGYQAQPDVSNPQKFPVDVFAFVSVPPKTHCRLVVQHFK